MNQAASIGIIGGADGPTAIFVTSTPSWVNWYGLIFLAAILIPNFLYALKKTKQENLCKNKLLNMLEQVGRYGCMVLMVIGGAFWKGGFSSFGAILCYFFGNFLLVFSYWICWFFFFRRPCKGLAVALAVLPTCVFLLSGITTGDFVLTVLAVVFGIGHISVTMHNFS